MRKLHTADEVFDELGGISAIAALTGRKYTAAANWRSFGKFPANTYLAIHAALQKRGVHAPATLWGMASESKRAAR